VTHPLADKLGQAFPGGVVEANEAFGELTIVVRPDRIVDVLRFLRDDPETAYNQLSDVTAVDWPERAERFDVVYHLNSLTHRRRLRIKACLPEADPTIDSVYPVFKLAGFGEREVFDLFGIRFRNHPDLRRIFLPEDYDGHPLRKDYPAEGRGWRTDMDFIPIGPIPDGNG
jgi:NADH/F420H2 dehydrogenase subunit C